MSYLKGTNSEHFDSMLQEISQVNIIQEKNKNDQELIITDECYRAPIACQLREYLGKWKLKLSTFGCPQYLKEK